MDSLDRTAPCALCSQPVPETFFRSGAAKIFHGSLLCAPCTRLADKQSFAQKAVLECSHCRGTVTLAHVRAGTALSKNGEPLCPSCAQSPPRPTSRPSARTIFAAPPVSSAAPPISVAASPVNVAARTDPTGETTRGFEALIPLPNWSGGPAAAPLPAMTPHPGVTLPAAAARPLPALTPLPGVAPLAVASPVVAAPAGDKREITTAFEELIPLPNWGTAAPPRADPEATVKFDTVFPLPVPDASHQLMDPSTVDLKSTVEFDGILPLLKTPATSASPPPAETVISAAPKPLTAPPAGANDLSPTVARSPSTRRAPLPGGGVDGQAKKARCPTCDGALDAAPFTYGGQKFCTLCRPVFEAVLAESRAAVPAGALCTSCHKAAAGPNTINLGDDVVCGSCTRAGQYLVQCRVREKRTGGKSLTRGGFPRVSILGVFLPIFAVAGVAAVAVWKTNGLVQKAPPPPPQYQESPAVDAIRKARAIVSRVPGSYEEAVKSQDDVAQLVEQARADTSLTERADAVLAQAKATSESFAPSVAGKLLEAAGEAGKKGDYAAAVHALQQFPAALSSTTQGKTIATALARYSALDACDRAAKSYLAFPHPRLDDIDSLMASPSWKLCDFGKTKKGEELAAKRRQVASQGPDADADGTAGAAAVKRELDRGRALEKSRNWDGAREAYKNALKADGDSVDALVALANLALTREWFEEARHAAERAQRLAPDRADVQVLTAWLAHLGRDPRGHDQAFAALARVPAAKHGPLARRLDTILRLGAPRQTLKMVRAFSTRTEAEWDGVELVNDLDALAVSLQVALALKPDDGRVDLFLFDDAGDATRFGAQLGSTNEGLTMGAFGVLGTKTAGPALRLAVAKTLAQRAHGLPGWLRLVLPEVAEKGAVKPALGTVTVDKLEKLGFQNVQSHPDALESARGFAALIYSPDGPAALGRYVASQVDPAKAAKARTDLEAAVRRAAAR